MNIILTHILNLQPNAISKINSVMTINYMTNDKSEKV